MHRGTNEHLLEVTTLDKLPEEHRPTLKWTAVRLRIPHELRIRLTPSWIRRYTNTRSKRKLPRDPRGRVLEGLENLEFGDEIWMHVAPTKDELERHGLRPGKELETDQEEGVVEVTGEEGRQQQGRRRGIEQRYMERG